MMFENKFIKHFTNPCSNCVYKRGSDSDLHLNPNCHCLSLFHKNISTNNASTPSTSSDIRKINSIFRAAADVNVRFKQLTIYIYY